MLTHEYQTMRNVEDTYWWYRTLRSMVTREVEQRLRASSGRLLDAGCGTGGMMEHLRRKNENWNLVGVDASPDAVRLTRDRGFQEVAAGSVSSLPFADAAFDGVVSLDVLYHNGVDQEQAVAEFARVLNPGGFLVLNLPAFSALSGRHDAAVNGARRYTSKAVRALLQPAGFRIETLHYWNAWLFMPALAWRILSRLFHPRDARQTRSDLAPMVRPLNHTLAAVSQADAHLCRLARLPVGTSVFAVATRV